MFFLVYFDILYILSLYHHLYIKPIFFEFEPNYLNEAN